MTSAVKNAEQTGLGQIRPGTQVAVLDHGSKIATATFLLKENDLYSQLAFVANCSEGSDLHELPHPVQNKMHIEDLQVDDIFLWKHSKICSINASALEAPHVTSYEERSTRSSRGSKPKRFQDIK